MKVAFLKLKKVFVHDTGIWKLTDNYSKSPPLEKTNKLTFLSISSQAAFYTSSEARTGHTGHLTTQIPSDFKLTLCYQT